MPNQDEAKRKIRILATRIQNRQTTLTEDSRLDTLLASKKITNRGDVRRVLEEGLQKNASEVVTTLANHDDSDRLIDEIVQALGK